MKLSELVDISELRELCESFTSITGAVTAILDLEGNILTATGWQDLCTRFHRADPATANLCRESDTVLANLLGKGEPYNVYKCKNGLIDVAVPITIGGEHVANFFTGQFFLEPPDKEHFILQAEEFGFDKDSYIEALKKVPIFSKDKVRSMMEFFTRLAQLIGEMGLARKNFEKANAELRKHQEHLEELVMERTDELSRANRELQAEIAERKRAEAALRESEQRFRTLAAATFEGIAITEHGQFLDVNERLTQILGYEQSKLIGLEVADVLPPEERDRVLASILSGYESTIEHEMLCKDGSRRIVEAHGKTIDQQGRHLRITAIRDITDRKRAEEALHKSELKFSNIFHSVPALIGITTVAEGRCIDINEAGLRALGYQREEMIGKTMLELGVWESKSARDRVIRVLDEDGMVRDLEVNLKGKSGKIFTGLFSAEIIDINGEQYLLSIINDITERKRMEEEIKRLNIELAEKAADLEATNKEQEAFNHTVAHDLRQPLNALNSYCQVIDKLCGDQLQEECKGYVRDAYNVTLRMNSLIEALLNFSNAGIVDPRREMVDLSLLAQEVSLSLKMTELERQVDFRITEGIVANCDAILLRAVLDNLLGNAYKFTGMREKAVIEFGARDIDGMLTYFVKDNGAGFDMTDADKIFTPFQRLPDAEKCRGFGIGLATVERIIRRHGGKVWAEGDPGKGACFYFTLSAD